MFGPPKPPKPLELPSAADLLEEYHNARSATRRMASSIYRVDTTIAPHKGPEIVRESVHKIVINKNSEAHGNRLQQNTNASGLYLFLRKHSRKLKVQSVYLIGGADDELLVVVTLDGAEAPMVYNGTSAAPAFELYYAAVHGEAG